MELGNLNPGYNWPNKLPQLFNCAPKTIATKNATPEDRSVIFKLENDAILTNISSTVPVLNI